MFNGLTVIGILLMLIYTMAVVTVLCVIVGVLIRKKNKKASKVLFVIAGILAVILMVSLAIILFPRN